MRQPVISFATMAALSALITGCAAIQSAGAAASGRTAACTASELGVAFAGASQPGTGGTALAFVRLWDKSPQACLLSGPVTVVGLGRHGRPVTTPARFSVPPGSRLSADGTGPSRRGLTPGGEASASMLLIGTGTGRHGSTSSCPGHRVDPPSWRVDAAGGALTVRNESHVAGPALTADGGLTTCRGRLGGQSPLSVSRGQGGCLVDLRRRGSASHHSQAAYRAAPWARDLSTAPRAAMSAAAAKVA